jgi:RecG-like helicase
MAPTEILATTLQTLFDILKRFNINVGLLREKERNNIIHTNLKLILLKYPEQNCLKMC